MAIQGRGADLLAHLETIVAQYCQLRVEGAPLVVASWILHTYLVEIFNYTPYLLATSPVPRCGKTRLLEVLATFSRRPEKSESMTEAMIFHTVDDLSPTLLIDEGESLKVRSISPVMLSLLNSGFQRGGCVHRMYKGERRRFNTFCPKAIALIGTNLPDTLVDRSISLRMVRAQSGTVGKFFRADHEELAVAISEWGSNHNTLSDAYVAYNRVLHEFADDLGTLLGDRESDIWAPLLATMYVADRSRLQAMRTVAESLVADKRQREQMPDNLAVLVALHPLVKTISQERITTSALIKYLHAQPEARWHDLTEKKLAMLLHDFDIGPPKLLRFPGNHMARGYQRQQFLAAFAAYVEGMAA